MKTELCHFCIKSGILCHKCREKIETGSIGHTYLDVAKTLFKLEGKYSSLQNISLHNVYDVDNTIAIVVGSGDIPQLLVLGGRILRDLSGATNKNIRILEKSGNKRKFLEDLFMPIKVVAINTIWLPDGSTETRVVLSGKARRLSLSRRVLKTLAKKIRGITLRITFEDPRERGYR